MKKNILFSTILSFIAITAIGFLWHNVLFVQFYSGALSAGARLADGVLAPLLAFLVPSNLVMAIILVYFIPQIGGINTYKTFAMRGMMLGAFVSLHLGLVVHAVMIGWPTSVFIPDMIYGIITGGVVGVINYYFFQKSMNPGVAQ